MMNRFSTVSLLLLGLLVSVSGAADPNGTWRWEHEEEGAMVKNVLKMTEKDGKLSGTLQVGDETYTLENTSYKGKTVALEISIDADGNPITVAFLGDIDGDGIEGTVDIGGFLEASWTATRDSSGVAAATDPPADTVEANAIDPSGTWRWEHFDEASQSMIPDVLKLTYKDGNVAGIYEVGEPATQHEVRNANLEGSTLSWEFVLDADGNDLLIAFVGKVSGNDVQGTVTLTGIGEFPWSAKRDAEASNEPEQKSEPTIAERLASMDVPVVLAKSIEKWETIPPHIKATVEQLLDGELKKIEEEARRKAERERRAKQRKEREKKEKEKEEKESKEKAEKEAKQQDEDESSDD